MRSLLLIAFSALLLASCSCSPTITPSSEQSSNSEPTEESSDSSTISSSASSDATTGHVHTYSDEYSYDEEYHWRQATCEHSDLVTDLAEHDLHVSEDGLEQYCSVCDYRTTFVDSLDKPTNLAFSDGVLSFDAVEHAASYKVTVTKDSDTVFEETVTETSVTIGELDVGTYVASVIAKNGSLESEAAILSFEIDDGLYFDGDLIIEAENSILNPKHYSLDSHAHNGAYALAFDDCGQGMYFRYYAFEAGNRDVTVTYSTGMANSYHTLFINGNSYKVTYSENTDWFGDSHVTADVTIQDVPFVLGWNELYLIKNGTGSDDPSYGGYAQIDYITIEGTQQKFDLTEFDMVANVYNLEGEAAKWHWTSTSQRPTNWGGKFSLGYGLGEMNKDNDGVTFSFYIADGGTFALRPVLGGNKSLYVKVDSGEKTKYEFGEYTQWDDPVTTDASICQVELEAGTHTIDITRYDNWFTFDKLVIERIV